MSERQKIRTVETTTTTNKILGQPLSEKVVRVEKLEYIDLEDLGFKKKAKKTVRETPSIPKDLRNHAESFISRIYADAKEFWNPSAVGDIDGVQIRAGYQIDTDEPQYAVGVTLRDRDIKPETLLRLCNNVFSSSEGLGNKEFQEFLKGWINIRMGIREKKDEPPKDENF